jgi:hypothetical protein
LRRLERKLETPGDLPVIVYHVNEGDPETLRASKETEAVKAWESEHGQEVNLERALLICVTLIEPEAENPSAEEG